MKTLSPEGARRFYDRIGQKQDSQAFYEDKATDELIRQAGFSNSEKIVEFGCGTGRFAEKLLSNETSNKTSYMGFDISPKMVTIATRRLEKYGERAKIFITDGSSALPLPDSSCDRFVTNYVMDLLSESRITELISEAHRVLVQDGYLCIASLTYGTGILSKTIISVWKALHGFKPSLVGGCRPIRAGMFVSSDNWQIVYNDIIVSWGIPSEVLVAKKAG